MSSFFFLISRQINHQFLIVDLVQSLSSHLTFSYFLVLFLVFLFFSFFYFILYFDTQIINYVVIDIFQFLLSIIISFSLLIIYRQNKSYQSLMVNQVRSIFFFFLIIIFFRNLLFLSSLLSLTSIFLFLFFFCNYFEK